MASNRRGINNLALMSARFEFGCCCLNAPQNTFDIDFQDTVDFFGLNIGNRLNLCDARIVDDDVEAAEFLSAWSIAA